DDDLEDDEIVETLKVSKSTVCRIRKSYCEGGLDFALSEKPRGVAPTKIDGRAEIELSALSKQCLDRRMADMKILKHEVSAWESESAPRCKQTGHPRRRRMKAEPCNPDRNLS
ncbi:MAG: hypothetical protein WBL92_08500, partial [Methanothrix sp.]